MVCATTTFGLEFPSVLPLYVTCFFSAVVQVSEKHSRTTLPPF